MSLSNVLLPSATPVSTLIGRMPGLRDSQKHRSTLPTYPYTTQEFLIIAWWRDAFPRPHCGRRSPPYPVIDSFTNLFDHTRLGVRDEEERTRYRSLGMAYGKGAYDAAAESTMVFPVRYRMKGSPKTPSVTRPVIKG